MARAAVIPKSPPKRATRTRGRPAAGPAASTAAARAKAKTTASKSIAEPKTTARAATTDVTDELTEDDELGAIDNQEKAKPTRGLPKASATTTSAGVTGTGRGRKPAARPATPEPESDDDDDELAQEDIPKKQVGRPMTKPQPREDASTKQQEPTARPRGRPKGSTNAKSTAAKSRTQTEPELPAETLNPKQVTINSAALRSNILRGPAKKKTVTFQDVSGSEEEEEPAPAPAGRRRRTNAARRQTGVAKPARKPATGGTGRGRKPAAKGTPKPLSPKKANQVTKSITSYGSSDGEDDELSGAKNQVKLLVDSPTKHGSESTGLSSPVKRINFTPRQASKSVDENGNPVRRSIDFNDVISMSSPTREPSPSPFHYTMRETPKRVGFAATKDTQPISQPNFGPSQNSPLKASPKKGHMETPKGGGFTPGIDLKPLAQPNFTAMENSPLKASPKKGHLDTPKASSMAPWDGTKPLTQPNFTPAQNSPLKTSPKKGNLAASFSQSAMKSSTPLFNARISSLQSPAKRTASPFKSSMSLRKTPLFAPQQPESTISRDEDIDVAAPSTPEVKEPSRPHDEDNDAASPLAPEAEEPLRLDELDDDVNEDKEQVGGELDDGTMHAQAEVQSHVHDDEMEGVATSSDTQHASNFNEDHAPEDIEEESELPTHQDVRQEFAAESLPDFGDEPAETFAVETEDRFQVSTQDNPNEHYDDHVDNGIEAQAESDSESVQDHGEQDADDLMEDVQPVFEDHAEEAQVEPEEPPKEPEDPQEVSEDELQKEEPHETVLRHENNHVETSAEAENGVHEEFDRQSQQDDGGPKIQHGQEVPSPQLSPEHPEDVGADDNPVSESADENDRPDEDIQTRGSENKDHHEASVHRENKESDDDGDDGDFEFDGETTLVNVDVNQQYMDDVRLLSPERRNQVEREPSSDDVENLPAPVPSPPVFRDDRYRDAMDDKMDSDEDSQSDIGFATNNEQGLNRSETPDLSQGSALGSRAQAQRSIFDNAPHFTPLAQQFSQWKTSTPKESEPRRPRRRGVFSIGGALRRPSGRISVGFDVSQPAISRRSIASSRKSSLASVSTQQDTEQGPMESMEHAQQGPEPEPEPETIQDAASKADDSPRQPMAEIFTDQEPEATASEENHEILRAPDSIPSQDASPTPSVAPSIQNEPDNEKENENIRSPAPAPAPVTPMKNRISPMQTVHTVSKVPLKPEGDVSPLKMPIKRRRSLSNASPTRSSPRVRKSLLFTSAKESMPSFPPRKSPRMEELAGSPRQVSDHRARSVERRQSKPTKAPSRSPSPAKSPRKSVSSSGVLEGAVVYVDVHTTEGEDASGIFVELLQQMGAKCIKNWSWNRRASLMPEDNATAQQMDGKVGITHVVFKDGGVRTLEKVRCAGGLVKCVGVGWVLDCERENKWLDETHYAVDSSIIPRGGAKRRKSMEPRALSNVNGTLIKTDSSASSSSSAANRRHYGVTPPMSRDSPQTLETASRRYDVNQMEANDQAYCQTPKTPGYRFNMENYVGMSPATPFYLSRAKLVQQSCPPKQTRQGLFPTLATSSNRDEEDEEQMESSRKLRLKLEAARRKSLAYKPRKGSPLVE